MTSATLYREGPDLDALLAELDAQYPGRVQVVEVLHPREGGVLGFFARQRVGVHYRLTDGPAARPAAAPSSVTEPIPAEPRGVRRATAPAGPLDRVRTDHRPDHRPDDRPDDLPDSAGAEFARLLAELAVRTATERRAADRATTVSAPDWAPVTTPPSSGSRAVAPAAPGSDPLPPLTAPPTAAPATAPGDGPTRHATRLALRRQLVEVGVPVDQVPADAPHAYAAIEDLTRRLPKPPVPPTGPGRILVIAGPADAVRAAAEAVVAGAAIDPDRVWAHCGPADLVPARRVIGSAADARSMATAARGATGGPTVVVVATGSGPVWGDSPAAVIAALQPDAVWAIVDATSKPADTRRALGSLGSPDALIVTNADRTTSPATVWELGIPIAMLGDRPSSGPAWAVLLLEALAELERACSDARR